MYLCKVSHYKLSNSFPSCDVPFLQFLNIGYNMVYNAMFSYKKYIWCFYYFLNKGIPRKLWDHSKYAIKFMWMTLSQMKSTLVQLESKKVYRIRFLYRRRLLRNAPEFNFYYSILKKFNKFNLNYFFAFVCWL